MTNLWSKHRVARFLLAGTGALVFLFAMFLYSRRHPEDNSRAADRRLDHIHATVQMLARHPQMGKRRYTFRSGLHSFTVGGHLLFYLPREHGIVLVRVLSGYRDLDALFD